MFSTSCSSSYIVQHVPVFVGQTTCTQQK